MNNSINKSSKSDNKENTSDSNGSSEYLESHFNHRLIKKGEFSKKNNSKKPITLVNNTNRYHALQEVEDIQNDNKVVQNISIDMNS